MNKDYTLDGCFEKIQPSSKKMSKPANDRNRTRSSAVSRIRKVNKPAAMIKKNPYRNSLNLHTKVTFLVP